MLSIRVTWLLSAALAVVGCGGRAPTPEEVEDAKARVQAALLAGEQARAALELLGILPDYTCGEPRAAYVEALPGKLQAEFGCVTATTEALDESSDGLYATFAAEGCELKKRTLTGNALFRYSGGEDRMELEVDFRQVKLDDQPLQARAGYGTCGDEKRYWATAEGALPNHPEKGFKLDGVVAKRDGLPVIGGTTLILDGPGEVRHPDGVDRATFTGLVYELGEYLPREGQVLIETSSGHTVQAVFKNHLWRLGEAEITVDDSEPKRVPILQ